MDREGRHATESDRAERLNSNRAVLGIILTPGRDTSQGPVLPKVFLKGRCESGEDNKTTSFTLFILHQSDSVVTRPACPGLLILWGNYETFILSTQPGLVQVWRREDGITKFLLELSGGVHEWWASCLVLRPLLATR